MYSPVTFMKTILILLSSSGESSMRTSPIYFPRISTSIEEPIKTLSVWALGSTDSGVSWIVETEGKRIFHAGDLNNWYARFLQDVKAGETIYSEEFDEEIDPIAHEKQYLGELKDIRKVADSFDVVMFPVDGRIGNGYTLGARQFIERFKVGLFVPMHFVASGFESAWRMKEFTDEKGIPFWEISREGETIDI